MIGGCSLWNFFCVVKPISHQSPRTTCHSRRGSCSESAEMTMIVGLWMSSCRAGQIWACTTATRMKFNSGGSSAGEYGLVLKRDILSSVTDSRAVMSLIAGWFVVFRRLAMSAPVGACDVSTLVATLVRETAQMQYVLCRWPWWLASSVECFAIHSMSHVWAAPPSIVGFGICSGLALRERRRREIDQLIHGFAFQRGDCQKRRRQAEFRCLEKC